MVAQGATQWKSINTQLKIWHRYKYNLDYSINIYVLKTSDSLIYKEHDVVDK